MSPIGELKAGDLVFFKSEKANSITHVGIYIGETETLFIPVGAKRGLR